MSAGKLITIECIDVARAAEIALLLQQYFLNQTPLVNVENIGVSEQGIDDFFKAIVFTESNRPTEFPRFTPEVESAVKTQTQKDQLRINELIKAETIVIAPRFIDPLALISFQGQLIDNVNIFEKLEEIRAEAVIPDLTIWVEIPRETLQNITISSRMFQLMRSGCMVRRHSPNFTWIDDSGSDNETIGAIAKEVNVKLQE